MQYHKTFPKHISSKICYNQKKKKADVPNVTADLVFVATSDDMYLKLGLRFES